jgi:hypothetical protein
VNQHFVAAYLLQLGTGAVSRALLADVTELLVHWVDVLIQFLFHCTNVYASNCVSFLCLFPL